MEKKFQIVFKASTASTAEITDSIADVFGVAYEVEKALSDGFQLTDVLTAIQQEPIVKEVINDFPVFIDEIKQVSGTTLMVAVKAAKERSMARHGDLGRIGTFVYDILIQAATTFSYIEGTVVGGIAQLDQWKAILASVKQPAA